MINSGKYDGLPSTEAREQIVADLVKKKIGEEQVNYKLRDWLISRQRYWGAPIPIIHCPKDGAVAVPKKDLPLQLPVMDDFQPSGDGQSPLARAKDWVETKCPTCGGPARRETDTMDGFACSSWYFLRFADPHNAEAPFSKEKAAYWLPVDLYVGGAEHAVMHLLYARMWTKVMHDAGLINFDEPFKALRNLIKFLIVYLFGNPFRRANCLYLSHHPAYLIGIPHIIRINNRNYFSGMRYLNKIDTNYKYH